MTHSLTALTLAQLLTSEDATVYRNAMSILKVLRECDHNYDGTAAVSTAYGLNRTARANGAEHATCRAMSANMTTIDP